MLPIERNYKNFPKLIAVKKIGTVQNTRVIIALLQIQVLKLNIWLRDIETIPYMDIDLKNKREFQKLWKTRHLLQ